MADDIILSASSVNTYLECPLEWYFSYVLMERGETTLKKVVGIAVHESVERILRHLLEPSGPAPDPGAVFEAAFDAEMARGPVRMSDGEDPLLGYESGIASLRAYIKALIDNVDEVANLMAVEAPFEIVVDGIAYSGTIDRIDTFGGGLLVRDTKTSASRPPRGRYQLNMTGYALGAEALTGRPTRLMVLDYIVRTKQPYYWPEYLDAPSPSEQAAFSRTLDEVASGVARRYFPPLGLETRACYGCPHTNTCGPYQRMQARET